MLESDVKVYQSLGAICTGGKKSQFFLPPLFSSVGPSVQADPPSHTIEERKQAPQPPMPH